MVKTKIPLDIFVRAMNFLDRVVGSVEPVNRRVYFYTRGGELFAYASDGCLCAGIALGKSPNFEGFYAAPLDNLKLLSKGRDENIELRFGDKLEILTGPEYMVVTHPYARDPRKRGPFVADKMVNAGRFRNTLDVGSIILREGQEVMVGCDGERFFLICEENSHVSAAYMELKMNKFVSRVPYESVRHLLKSLDVLSQGEFLIGNSQETLGLKFKDGLMTLCKYDAPDIELKDVENFLRHSGKGGFVLETKLLKEGASLASKFQKKNGGRGYIDFRDKLRIGVVSPYSAYEYSIPLKVKVKERFQISPLKLNQFLSRLHTKNISVVFDSNTLFFTSSHAVFAVKKR